MKANELNLEKHGYLFDIIIVPSRRSYQDLMELGRFFPTNASQAAAFIQTGARPDVWSMDDVEFVEAELSPFGFVGEYKYTKGHHFVRLKNIEDMYDALKRKYALPADMKQTIFKNKKIRQNVQEIIDEVPAGMRRYSFAFYNKYGSCYGSDNVEYAHLIELLEKYRDNIILWQVTTFRTPRTFTIELTMDCR